MSIIRHILMWLPAALFMGVVGTLIQTEFVLQSLSDIGASMSASDRWRMRMDDLKGLGPAYAGLCLIGFVLAFETADRASRRLRLPRFLVFASAGAICLTVMFLMSSEVFFGSPIIAGTRSGLGFASQIVLAAIAGLISAYLTSGPANNSMVVN